MPMTFLTLTCLKAEKHGLGGGILGRLAPWRTMHFISTKTNYVYR